MLDDCCLRRRREGATTALSSAMMADPGTICCALPLFWFTIPEGFYGLVSRRGARADYVVDSGSGGRRGGGHEGRSKSSPVWPCGLHFGPPWLKVSHLVTKQAVLFSHKIEGCMTKDNVSTCMDVSIVLRVMGDDPDVTPGDDPNNVYKFVHEVTPFGLQAQLRSSIAVEARTLTRSVCHAEVLGLRNFVRSEVTAADAKRVSFSAEVRGGGVAAQEEKNESVERDHRDAPVTSMMDAMRVLLNQQFKEQGIEILEVIIKDITLPDQVQSQMSQRTMIISQNAMERLQQKHAVQSMLHEDEIKLKQTYTLDQSKLIKEGEDAMMAQLELDSLRAEGEGKIRSIETQMSIDVELVKAENKLSVQRIEDETKLETEKIRVQSMSDVEVELAETKNEVDLIFAKGDLEVAKNVAKGEKAIFKAEGISAPLNRRLNDHLSSLHSLKAQSALANNGELVIVGTKGGGSAHSLLQADAALSSIHENWEDTSHDSIITEIVIASSGRRGASVMLGLPFVNMAPRRKGTQSLPDSRTLHRQRVHEIIAERKGMNRPNIKLDENLS